MIQKWLKYLYLFTERQVSVFLSWFLLYVYQLQNLRQLKILCASRESEVHQNTSREWNNPITNIQSPTELSRLYYLSFWHLILSRSKHLITRNIQSQTRIKRSQWTILPKSISQLLPHLPCSSKIPFYNVSKKSDFSSNFDIRKFLRSGPKLSKKDSIRKFTRWKIPSHCLFSSQRPGTCSNSRSKKKVFLSS